MIGHHHGSTFKLASILAYLEDSDISIYDSIDTGNGEYKFYSEVMKDHKPGGYGTISIKEVFEKSSNIGVAKLIDDQFSSNPDRFLNYIKKFGLNKSFDFQVF